VSGRFEIVLADPAWRYNNVTIRGGAEAHYLADPLTARSTMSLDEICALPVPRIAADNAALFLWATWPCLEDGLAVIRAWGFKYKNCGLLWVKTTKAGTPHMGLGHWTRGATEPCLFATRGKLSGWRQDAGVRQDIVDDSFTPEGLAEHLIACERGEHSAKPPEARDRVVQLLGERPRIELFAREHTPGWHAWGNQLPPMASTDSQIQEP